MTAAGLPGDDLPARPVDPDWLALREPADAQARDSTAGTLLPPLLARLGAHRLLRVVDLGAGTGANLRWLAPRLGDPGTQRWTLVDHDARLRAHGPSPYTAVRADVAELERVLTDAGADLVTASALLDLLDPSQLAAVVRAVTARRLPALFSLNVTGEVALDPPDPLDAELAMAFDAHQRRGGRLGPDAGDATAAAFRALGWDVVPAATPWRLAAGHDALLAAYLDGRVEAVLEWTPSLAGPAQAWLGRRLRQLADGGLSATVGHVDVLALPPESG